MKHQLLKLDDLMTLLGQKAPKPDTWTVTVRLLYPGTDMWYNQADFEGYASSTNAIAAADIFGSLGEDISLVFKDRGQEGFIHDDHKIDVRIRRIEGDKNDTVRY